LGAKVVYKFFKTPSTTSYNSKQILLNDVNKIQSYLEFNREFN